VSAASSDVDRRGGHGKTSKANPVTGNVKEEAGKANDPLPRPTEIKRRAFNHKTITRRSQP
jgi:hypothetical protein